MVDGSNTPTDLLAPNKLEAKSPPPPSRGRAKALRKNMTDAEKKLWYELRDFKHLGHYFRRQVPIGKYITDFACLKSKLIVELDGGHHTADDKCNMIKNVMLGLGQKVLRFFDFSMNRFSKRDRLF